MKKINLNFPIHPFLFAAFPILFFYSNNIKEVFLDVLPLPIFYSFILTIVVFLLSQLVLRNWTKAAVSISTFLIIFFSFGHIRGFGVDERLLLFIWALVYATIVILIVRGKNDLLDVNKYLNFVSFLLVAFSLANIAYFEISSGRAAAYFDKKSEETSVLPDLTLPNNPPDIYYIIFDRYAFLPTLKDLYGYDQVEDFEKFLTDGGFFIAKESKANYPRTFLSLGSSLNMEYVNYLSETIGESSNDESAGYYLLADYKVQELLKSVGYKYIHVGSWWETTRKNDSADANYFYSPFKFKYLAGLDEFSTKFLETTAASIFLTRTSEQGTREPLYGRTNHREGILFQFDILNEIVEKPGPKFVFAHILAPHFPYVFDENCRPVTEEEAKGRDELENYLKQLACTNKKIKVLVDKILESTSGNAIIIMQADEGPDPIKYSLAENWQNSSVEALREKTAILNASFFPDKNYGNLYESITPVNTFRVIFNQYFGGNFDLLEDKIYMIESKERPYKFFDITTQVLP